MIELTGEVVDLIKEEVLAGGEMVPKIIVVLHHDTFTPREGSPIKRYAVIEFFGDQAPTKAHPAEIGKRVVITAGIDGSKSKKGSWFPKLKGIKTYEDPLAPVPGEDGPPDEVLDLPDF